jgi:4-amino-4-deoxy-L-arabinose transferase-like glycosyltransferase
MVPSISRRAYFGGLVLIAATAIVVRLHLLAQPLDRDEGFYAYSAQRLLAGDVPYRDTFSDKPPVAIVIYAGFMLALGQTPEAIHLGGAIWMAGTAVLMAELARRIIGPVAGVVAGLLYAVTCAESTYQGSSINLELLLTPFVVIALLVIAAPRVSLKRVLLAGVLLGLALLTKQQAIGHAASAAALLFVHWTSERDRKFLSLVTRELLLGCGALAVLAVSIVLFYAVGALHEYVDGLWLYNIQTYVPHEPATRAWSNFAGSIRLMALNNPVFCLFALGGLGISLRMADGRSRWFVPLWWLSNLGAACIGLRFYKHYFLFPLPAMVLLATYAIDRLIQWTWNRNGASLRWLIVPVTGVVIAAPLLIQREYFFYWSTSRHVRELYGPELFAEWGRIAEFLAQNSSPNEPIYVYGSEPQVYFLAQRRCATRYAFVHPLTARGDRAIRRQQEAFDQLVRARPAFLLVVTIPMSHLTEPGATEFLWEQLLRLTRQSYDGAFAVQLHHNDAEYHYPAPGQAIALEQLQSADLLVLKRRSAPAH